MDGSKFNCKTIFDVGNWISRRQENKGALSQCLDSWHRAVLLRKTHSWPWSPSICEVTSAGHMIWYPGAKYIVQYHLNIKIPFDEQKCRMLDSEDRSSCPIKKWRQGDWRELRMGIPKFYIRRNIWFGIQPDQDYIHSEISKKISIFSLVHYHADRHFCCSKLIDVSNLIPVVSGERIT